MADIFYNKMELSSTSSVVESSFFVFGVVQQPLCFGGFARHCIDIRHHLCYIYDADGRMIRSMRAAHRRKQHQGEDDHHE